MKNQREITEYDVNMFFLKIFALFIACFAIFTTWIIFIEKSKVDLAKNNIYSYCTNIYKDYETSWELIKFIDHCMEKNK
jgi:hypothetical protein